MSVKENEKSIVRLKIALYAVVAVLAILAACTSIATRSLWSAINNLMF